MQLFDIIVITIVSLFIVLGIKRGFIQEIFHLVAMIGGLIGAYLTYPIVYTYIDFIKISNQAKTIISFIVAYIVIALTVILVGWIVKKIIHMVLLGWVDRILGGLIGGTKALIIIWIFFLSLSLMPSSELRDTFTSSQTYKFFKKFSIELSIPSSKPYQNI